ncbi:hypothetical protein V2I01_25045 [Micromonospora sp. BRA006-A]|nr:hypothetical protein [Micromonospora sp. BRA006-A]
MAPPAPVAVPARPRRLLGLGGRVLHRSAALLALAAIWETVPRAGLVDRVFLPRCPRCSPPGGSCCAPGSSPTTSAPASPAR